MTANLLQRAGSILTTFASVKPHQIEHQHPEAWSLPHVVAYFDSHRHSWKELYPSEEFFLYSKLHEGISILDIGCAQGGMAAVVAEKLDRFTYTGIDISADMIDRARRRHEQHEFHCVTEADFSVLGARQYDLVLMLGILHLHEGWRDTLATAWHHTWGSLLFDLRETAGETVEDETISWMEMDLLGTGERSTGMILPYIVLNRAQAFREVQEICQDARRVSDYGYTHVVSKTARGPFREVVTTAYCAEKLAGECRD